MNKIIVALALAMALTLTGCDCSVDYSSNSKSQKKNSPISEKRAKELEKKKKNGGLSKDEEDLIALYYSYKMMNGKDPLQATEDLFDGNIIDDPYEY